ncbi:hypothetical protein QF019_005177 [Pseudomonas frederiksbergensis]
MVPIAALHCRPSPTQGVGLDSKYWIYIQCLQGISQGSIAASENPVGGQKKQLR